MQNENPNLKETSDQLVTKQNENSNLEKISEQSVTKQNENLNLQKISEQSVTKWIIGASLVTFLLLTTFLFIGLKSQYIEVDFCVATVNCSQAPEQVTDKAQTIDMEEDSLEDSALSSKPIKIAVKPLGAAIVGGVMSTAAMAALIGLGVISLPIEFALVIGALIGSGTYLALKTLY